MQSPRIALEPRADWARAFDKAVETAAGAVNYLKTFSVNGHCLSVFAVMSSDAQTVYKVDVYQYRGGAVETRCSCLGGQNGNRCYHAAAALQMTGHLIEADVAAVAA